MAVLTVNEIVRGSILQSLVNCDAAGDHMPNTNVEFLIVKNADTVQHTLTFDIVFTVDGQAVADKTLNIAAGETRMVGPFPANWYNDANAQVKITYDAVTGMTIGAFKLGSV